VRYFEWIGMAGITLKWKKPGDVKFEEIPSSYFARR